MALERYVKPVEKKEEKPKRKKFWTKKKVLVVVLIAVVLAGIYPLGHWPVWLLIYLSIVHGHNPIWVIQQQIRIQMEYRAALTRKIEVTIAKGDEVKEMTPSSVEEIAKVMRKYEENPVYKAFLFGEEVVKQLNPNDSFLDNLVMFSGDSVEDSHYLFFKKPIPVWMDDRVLAIKILVTNDYGEDWPSGTFAFCFILLKPIKVCGWYKTKGWLTIKVIAVGYDTGPPRKDVNATVCTFWNPAEIGLPNGTDVQIKHPGDVSTYFYDFDQGNTYTLIVPFANLLKDNYVIGVRPFNMDVKVLEIGYVKP